MKTLGQVHHTEIPLYLNASNILLLTSKWEGSPNIVKEAMACNTIIVCTDVGDVRWLFADTDGCYISSYEVDDILEKLTTAIEDGRRTNARNRLIGLKLDAVNVAKQIVDVYVNICDLVEK